jgi:NAD(P)-dependent dehydrogenase (short-subunit alcohol dehydrogenase family)
VQAFHGSGWLTAGVEPVRTGNRHPSIAPCRVFPCLDASIVGAAVAHRPVTVDGSARVTILEKEDGLAQHQTRRKAGISIEEVRAQTEKAIPLGRYGTAEEFGKVAAFLVSAANSTSSSTAAWSGPLQIGDEVAVTIEGIGTLTDRIVAP